ncbi:MAG: 16S rRNA (guanine(966)-N(2))-methyltransferase RsmD [Clostridiales bacterium]|nr:16S rRNA (guanine(966)-N(2))-methyltransferase RsmD [Clostridiales bacterium]
MGKCVVLREKRRWKTAESERTVLEDRVRIIAGTARGRRFEAPKGMDTRPTLDRVKEAIFGSIQFDIPGSCVLDLFSGSGNLGFEATSRGANKVICNDHNRDCAEQIRRNAKMLALDGVVQVTCKDYAACLNDLARAGERFDFVFLDAPYKDGTAQKAAEQIFELGLLSDGGRVILEHAEKLPPQLTTSLAKLTQTRRYGSCAVSVFKRADSEAQQD